MKKEYHYKPKEDLTGKKFNHLLVKGLNREKSDKEKKGYWIVECDCPAHTTFTALGTNLKRNNTTKCKYCSAENLIGQKFNRLLVIERYITEENRVKWKCLCDCGNTTIVSTNSLKSGHTKSCGCLQRETVSSFYKEDLVGQQFGYWTVLSSTDILSNSGSRYWKCKCKCGTIKNVMRASLINGNSTSCGCIKSKGEVKILNILNNNNISFIREYSPQDIVLSTGGRPRFDFAVLNNLKEIAYFIEYQGEQHYISRGNIYTPEKVAIIQKRDEEKRQYCEEKGIPIIYIKYTDYDTFDKEDIIFYDLIEKNNFN